MVFLQNLLFVKGLIIARVNMQETFFIEVEQLQGFRGFS